MKKIMIFLVGMLTMSLQAAAMSYEQARSEALFLTDKMAYELNLSDAQYEAAYEINLDYLMSVSNRNNVLGSYWNRRNIDLRYVLHTWQWEAFCAANYFYRPLYWNAGRWHFHIYARYPHRDHFYYGRPHFYTTYRGGHSWRNNGGRSYYQHHYTNHHTDRNAGHHTDRNAGHHTDRNAGHNASLGNRDHHRGRDYQRNTSNGHNKPVGVQTRTNNSQRSSSRQR